MSLDINNPTPEFMEAQFPGLYLVNVGTRYILGHALWCLAAIEDSLTSVDGLTNDIIAALEVARANINGFVAGENVAIFAETYPQVPLPVAALSYIAPAVPES
jgi:hypothetical protein